MVATLDGRLPPWRRYSDTVRLRGPATLYLVAHPDGVKHVLRDNAASDPRPPAVRDRLQAIVGDGLVGAEGAGWVRSRRMAQPAFRRHHLDRFCGLFAEATAEVLDGWDRAAALGRPLGVEAEMVRVSLANLGASLFQADWRRDVDRVAPAVTDILAFAFFIAGHATIASALTWTWYLLSTHPESWRRLRAEVDEVLGGRPPAAADLPRLRYAGMVTQEAMRLYPPIYLLLRRALADDEVGGYRIPTGTRRSGTTRRASTRSGSRPSWPAGGTGWPSSRSRAARGGASARGTRSSSSRWWWPWSASTTG